MATVIIKRLAKSPFVLITVLVTLAAFSFTPRFPFKSFSNSLQQQRLFTAEELALYNGTDDTLPILLGILGSVFDVTKGKSHYGVGGGYHHFSGRDASRAFVSGNFTGDGLTDSLRGLSSTEVKSIVEWREFYFRSYTEGNPTKSLKGVEAKAARGTQLLEKQKKEDAKQPSCNSRCRQEEGGEFQSAFSYTVRIAPGGI
ncbi:PREDICTED: membrane-associated progesterone-binding protein 4-like [Populus euphratica]|uniref:Membrane-associated progesterone-binding protein 4-like n=1 Tax=Populus euphratica TaxID=75702 RepID=A0AAJ6X9B6_POPEU|nr:PREDICTED: membrane-associated progesterone-binding protein 4-like [Populus euphratica]